MEINFFGKKTLASLILFSLVNFIQFRFKDFNIDEMFLWKLYYEIQKLIERSPHKKIATEEEFSLLINDLIEEFDIIFEERVKQDPNFKEKFIQQNSKFWGLYKTVSTFFSKPNPIVDEIKTQINKKIIETPELLDYKVKRDVDYAISDYKKQEPKEEQNFIFTETLEGETALGGEMRIQAKWTINND